MSEEQSDLWGFEKVEEQMSEKQLSQDQMSWVALCTRSNLSEANVWVANVEEHLSGAQMSDNLGRIRENNLILDNWISCTDLLREKFMFIYKTLPING